MRVLVAPTGLVLTLGTLFVMLWSVVPPPTYRLFMVSVAASEWGLWIGGIALVGSCLGAWALTHGNPRPGSVALLCGLIAVGLALKPPLQARGLATQTGVSLSLARYVFGPPTPANSLHEEQDIVYVKVDGQPLHLDVYRPERDMAAAPSPAVVVVHGGSWSGGAKGEFRAMSRTLAADGAVVFDIEYRLASATTPFPAQIADVKCAIGWVKANAQTYGVDPQRIALLGRSAGGQLALLAAHAANDPRLQPSCPIGDTAVQAVISFYAPVDLPWGYDHPLRPDVINSRATLRRYLGGTPQSHGDLYRLASPTSHVSTSSPPTFIIHGGLDSIVGVQHARFMAEALQQAHVPHRLLILPWANHGFDFAANGWGSQIAETLVRQFLRTHV